MRNKKQSRSIFVSILLCGMIFLASACAPRTTVTRGDFNEGDANDPEETLSITFRDGGELALVSKMDIPIEGMGDSVGIWTTFDDRYFLTGREGNTEQVYEYRLTDDTTPTYIAGIEMGYLGSGDYIVTNDNEIWYSWGVAEEENLLLYKVDVQGKSAEVVRRGTANPPLQYYHKIDETQLLFFGPNMLVSDDGEEYYSYYIDVYDIAQNERKTIVQIGEPNVSRSMPCIDYADGLIYTLQTEMHSGDTSQMSGPYVIPGRISTSYVRVYDTEGNLKKEILLPDMTAFESQNNYFANMYVFDNIVFLSTLNRVIVAFEMLEDGTVQQLDLPLTLSTLFYTLKGRAADNAYLYNRNADRLIVYDRHTRCFTGYTILLNKELHYDVFLNDKGTLQLGLECPEENLYKIYEFEPLANDA